MREYFKCEKCNNFKLENAILLDKFLPFIKLTCKCGNSIGHATYANAEEFKRLMKIYKDSNTEFNLVWLFYRI